MEVTVLGIDGMKTYFGCHGSSGIGNTSVSAKSISTNVGPPRPDVESWVRSPPATDRSMDELSIRSPVRLSAATSSAIATRMRPPGELRSAEAADSRYTPEANPILSTLPILTPRNMTSAPGSRPWMDSSK
jgi:hypothetical protein